MPSRERCRASAVDEKLIAALNRPGQFILISAPAGFGKTTLLAELAVDKEQPIGWISLGDGDNDPNRLWSYVIAACQSIHPGVGEAALTLLQTPQPLADETIPTLLINDLVNLEKDLILILDDADETYTRMPDLYRAGIPLITT